MATTAALCNVICMLGVLLLLPLSCRAAVYRGTDCRAAYSCAQKGKQEVTNVMTPSVVATSSIGCMRECMDRAPCAAVNWRESDGLFELCSDTDLPTMVNDAGFIHYSTTNCDVAPMDCQRACLAPFQVVGGTCLYVGTTPLSWDDSRQACQDLSSDLVVVQSLQHGKDIMDFVAAETGSKETHVGAHYNEKFLWLNGDIGRPSSDIEVFASGSWTCVFLKRESGTLFLRSADCTPDHTKAYVCER